MKYISIAFNIGFFAVMGYLFYRSKKIPKVWRYIGGITLFSIAFVYAVYCIFCIITGREIILLY